MPLSAGILALATDALLNRRSGLLVIKHLDWSVVLMFLGLFIWVRGVDNTGLPRWLWHAASLSQASAPAILPIGVLCAVVLVGSSLLGGGVPLTLLLLAQLTPCGQQKSIVITLAWLSGVAANLTLFGGSSNLIVVQKGVQVLKVKLGFWQHLVYGLPVTILTTVLGLGIIMALMQITM